MARADIMEKSHTSAGNCAEKCGHVIADCIKDGRSEDQCRVSYKQCVSECVFTTYPYS
ncbi:MAG: hypothetical protein MUD16_02140 [Desulfobacterales bacterium]|nr:hypothetical protein [Desulfobacterales bacterium]